jgi:hypothetical protein
VDAGFLAVTKLSDNELATAKLGALATLNDTKAATGSFLNTINP